jgi:protein tyrosine phosphatase (PTP) superfamily phosphohydrolase (DUF442 family)
MKCDLWPTLLLACAAGGLLPWSDGAADDAPPTPHSVEADGLHNVFRITPRLYSGGGPEDDKGFASLKQLGIKTVVSVDGAKPDLERARKFGLRYVHIPIGYNGLPRDKALQIAKAMRQLPGPFYIHCHHGKHRGPTAAAVAQLCSDDKCRVEEALAVLRSAGTDPRYAGLFKSVREFQRPTARELATVAPELPEAVKATGMTQAMVAIDHSWDSLNLVRASGWRAPPGHPDIDPAHEALQLLEGFQELIRLPDVDRRPEDFRRWLLDGHASTKELERLLRAGKDQKAVDEKALETAYRRASAACTQCHAVYRDVP